MCATWDPAGHWLEPNHDNVGGGSVDSNTSLHRLDSTDELGMKRASRLVTFTPQSGTGSA